MAELNSNLPLVFIVIKLPYLEGHNSRIMIMIRISFEFVLVKFKAEAYHK